MVAGKQPAYGGEAEAARLRRAIETEDVERRRQYAALNCEHPATIIARVCASCDTIMEMETR